MRLARHMLRELGTALSFVGAVFCVVGFFALLLFVGAAFS